ncbi:MAG: hypothetical protein ACK42D_04245 [Candidatus Paceibacteria bacterium]
MKKYISNIITQPFLTIKQTLSKISLPECVLILSSAYILLSFILFYLIDLRNAFGLRDWLFSVDRVYFYFTYTPFFFQHYGRNSGFVELAQWGLLGCVITLCALLAGHFYQTHKKASRFFLLMTVAFVIILIEDAGDVRHMMMSYVQLAASEPDQGIIGTLFEGLYFAVLGGIPLYALIRYGRSIREYGKAWWYIIIGFVAHALAASLSFIGTAFKQLLERDLYTIMGDSLINLSYKLGTSDLPSIWEAWNADNWILPIGFFLMDSLIEENIELLGNAFLVAGILTIWQRRNELQKMSLDLSDKN